MGKVFVGLDMGSRSFHQVALDADKSVVHDRRFDTTEANLIRAFEDVKGVTLSYSLPVYAAENVLKVGLVGMTG